MNVLRGPRPLVVVLLLVLMASAFCVSCGRRNPTLNTDVSAERVAVEIMEAVPRLMDEANIPGLSIALIRDGETAWSGAYGVKSAITLEPVTETTVFEAASLTKPFFAYLVMKMVESGEIDLDRPLFKYVPQEYLETEYIGHSMDREGFNNEWFRTITARMVLSHSSGLPHGEPRDPLPIHFEPGSAYRYSADGYYYLQVVVEYLRGERLDEIMRREVIEPLGMQNSSLVWQDRYETMAAVGHDLAGNTTGEFRKRSRARASATLYTTALDYARFVNAVINGTGLDSATVDLMLSPQIEVEDGVRWSLGFGLDGAAAGTGFWQWGDFTVFRDFIIAYRKERIGVVYLTNSYNGLSIRNDIVSMSVGGGEHPVFSYPDYEQYYTPTFRIIQAAIRQGAEAAIKLYWLLDAESPEYVTWKVLNNAGNTLRRNDRPVEAVALLELNAEIYPDSSDSFLYLGEAYFENAQYAEALAGFRRKLDADPGHRGAEEWSLLAGLMHKVAAEGPEAGLLYLDELKENQPGTNWEHEINSHGYKLLATGKGSEAITVFKLNVAAFPDSWNVYDSLGEAYMRNGERELAIYYYMESLKRNPDNANGAEMLRKLKEEERRESA
ncbi:MAG: beta-lactamase family protein [bacterium]